MKKTVWRFFVGVGYVLWLLGAWGIEDGQSMKAGTVREAGKETQGAIAADQEEEGREGEKKIALTFDDGPCASTTPKLLEGLKERGVKASFFVIGESAERFPEIIKQEAKQGHVIGNHTYHHVSLKGLSVDEAKKELMDTSLLIESLTGEPTAFMRPPFGEWQKELEKNTKMMPVLWSVDPRDWTTGNVDEIVNKVVTETEENDIILLHDCYDSSVEAALRIIDLLQSEGFTFVTVEELLLD